MKFSSGHSLNILCILVKTTKDEMWDLDRGNVLLQPDSVSSRSKDSRDTVESVWSWDTDRLLKPHTADCAVLCVCSGLVCSGLVWSGHRVMTGLLPGSPLTAPHNYFLFNSSLTTLVWWRAGWFLQDGGWKPLNVQTASTIDVELQEVLPYHTERERVNQAGASMCLLTTSCLDQIHSSNLHIQIIAFIVFFYLKLFKQW